MTRTQILEVPVKAYRDIPKRLTKALDLPPAPPKRCEVAGIKVTCLWDAINYIPKLKRVIKKANADRATTAKLGAGDER